MFDPDFITQQFFILLTPVAVLTAALSGAALGLVIHALRPTSDYRLTTYLTVVLGVLWYWPAAVQLAATGSSPWATLSKFCLYVFAFVPAMWLVLRWRRQQ